MAGWDAKRPYNALPELPPAADLETRAVLKRCVEARAALEGLRRSTQLIPNPGMLVSTLPVLEAQASSEIENVVTTADALFQHLHNGGSSDPATREALRYREALLEGFRELKRRPVSTRLAESICTTIKGVEMEVRRVPGTALQPSSSGKVVYTPPETESRLRDLMANWERFVHADDALDPLVRLAAAHYQFEAIHPFTDGNGRTGRVLNSLMLVERGLLDAPVLYLSRYIIRHKTEYYGRLLAVTRDAEWEQWVLYLLEAVEDTARWTTHKIDAIRALEVETARRLRERLPKIHSRELVELLFTQPYCRIANLVAAGIAGRQAAARYLKALVDAGVLKEKPVGREKLFVHSRLLELLTRDGKATASPARRGTRQT